MQLEVRVVFRVKPEDAPFMVAKIGSVEKLVQNVMHPLIDSIFRNQASESSAMAYLQNRHEEQERAEARVRAHLLKYHVDGGDGGRGNFGQTLRTAQGRSRRRGLLHRFDG